MEKDYLIKLCLAIYRITDLFPEREPLRISLREKANQILADSILFFNGNPVSLTKEQKKRFSERILGNISILQGYFEIAEKQNWLRRENFSVLEREYNMIEKEIKNGFSKKESSDITKKEKSPSQVSQISLDELKKGRYKRILEVLKEKEEVQVKDLKEIFSRVSKRTLRRDLNDLLKKGFVKRVGDKNRTVYKLR